MKVSQSFTTSVTIYKLMYSNIPEDLNPKLTAFWFPQRQPTLHYCYQGLPLPYLFFYCFQVYISHKRLSGSQTMTEWWWQKFIILPWINPPFSGLQHSHWNKYSWDTSTLAYCLWEWNGNWKNERIPIANYWLNSSKTNPSRRYGCIFWDTNLLQM